ncbi:hypothetical protein HPB49_012318 [Dermacentor silvarum]|uniref:Uncharacterized protein n=1 Tax=Dermacentor silvarum TaxID=543639 RepID=A0ACB8DPD7_DERSI|nr:hypothetical protein HPB49_012318 [Dermacentor silvarum]
MAASNSNPAGQLDCMDAEYIEPEHDIGPCDYRPGLSGAADASIDTLPQPPVPRTPCYRVVDIRRRRVVAEESSKKPPAPFDSRERRQGPGRPRLPRLPEGDHKVVLRIRGGISLQQEVVLPLRAAIQTALRAPLPLEARIRVRKEQNIALVSTPDPDLAEQLCHIQTLLLGSKSYEVSAYVASPDNSCKGIITGALPIPTEDALINETVTYPHAVNIIQARPFGKNRACLYTFEGRRAWNFDADLSAQSPKCATAASEPDIDTTSAHTHKNGGAGTAACLTQMNTTNRGLGPRVVKEGRQDTKGHNTTPPRRDTKVSTTNQQPGDIPKNTCSQGPQSTAQSKEPKISYHEKKTKQHVQPRVPPTIRTPATPLSNQPPLAPAQCGARSEVTSQHSRNENPPKHLARWQEGGPRVHPVRQQEGAWIQTHSFSNGRTPWPTLGYNVASVTSRTAVLINKTLPFIDRTPTGGPSEGGTEYTALEMIPSNLTSGKGLLVVNIYSYRCALALPAFCKLVSIIPSKKSEAQRSNQLLRLSRTPTGRNLLRTLGCEPSCTIPNEEPWCPIPVKLAAHMHLKPLPRNMNVQRYLGRRKARADYYARRYQNREDVLYVDAAVGPLEGTATVAAMTEDGRINISVSVKTARTDVAEGVALGLAA